jgi:hypothetical protein
VGCCQCMYVIVVLLCKTTSHLQMDPLLLHHAGHCGRGMYRPHATRLTHACTLEEAAKEPHLLHADTCYTTPHRATLQCFRCEPACPHPCEHRNALMPNTAQHASKCCQLS